nr:MAG TPA: hypothetical protein [Caudoviricetes sp.]
MLNAFATLCQLYPVLFFVPVIVWVSLYAFNMVSVEVIFIVSVFYIIFIM